MFPLIRTSIEYLAAPPTFTSFPIRPRLEASATPRYIRVLAALRESAISPSGQKAGSPNGNMPASPSGWTLDFQRVMRWTCSELALRDTDRLPRSLLATTEFLHMSTSVINSTETACSQEILSREQRHLSPISLPILQVLISGSHSG